MKSDDDHTAPDGDDEEQGGESKVVMRRSYYACNLCKRRFSNAQALGGHMNIHRKDKAKLNNTSTQSSTQPFFLDIHHNKVPLLLQAKSGEEEEGSSYSKNWPTRKVTLTQQDHETELLPLFADSPIITNKETQKPHDGERDFPSSHQGLSSSELLDLELRLGPHPDHEDSSATKSGTRKFF